jgi:uncharacterized protein
LFHVQCVSTLEHHNKHDSKAHEELCPLCRTDIPDGAEKALIEGCRLYFILKSNVQFGKECTIDADNSFVAKRKLHEKEMMEHWRVAAHLGNDRAMENLAHCFNHGDCADQDYEMAAFWYQKQADKGNCRSQFRLGRLYELGLHFKQDYSVAADLYLKAAEKGYPKGQIAYAKLLLEGNGVKKDVFEAEKWIELAAQQGNKEAKLMHAQHLVGESNYDKAFEVYVAEAQKGIADAQFNLGVLSLNGQGTKKDHQKAFLYFLLAADQEHVEACNCLGHMFQEGLGCEENEEQALYWFDKAAAHGCMDSQVSAAKLHLKIKTSGTEFETNEQVASRLYNEAAEHGNLEAQLVLATLAERKQGAVQKALKWYLKAAQQGDVDAMMHIGDIFFYGKGIKQSHLDAGRWYKLAANLNYPEAQKNLGFMFYYGLGVTRSYQEAERWYVLAAENNNAKAQYYLGKMFLRGVATGGKEQCFEHAAFWLHKSAEQGEANAQFNLARLYANGQGVVESVEKSKEWAQKAAAQGHDGALELLKVLDPSSKVGKEKDKNKKPPRMIMGMIMPRMSTMSKFISSKNKSSNWSSKEEEVRNNSESESDNEELIEKNKTWSTKCATAPINL